MKSRASKFENDNLQDNNQQENSLKSYGLNNSNIKDSSINDSDLNDIGFKENEFNEREFQECFFDTACFLASPYYNKAWILYGQQSRSKSIKNYPAFFLNDFFLKNSKPWIAGNSFYEMEYKTLSELISKQSCSGLKVSWEEKDKSAYKKVFEYIKEEITKGKIEKAVPFYIENGNVQENGIQKDQLVYLLKSIFENNVYDADFREGYDGVYLYGFWDLSAGTGCVGVSPELIFLQEKQKLYTNALAGTFRLSAEENQQQNTDFKTRKEHQIVIDNIKMQLSSFGKVTIEKTNVFKLKHFAHLKTKIQIDLHSRKFDFDKILHAIHPTAALGGMPKENALLWLQEIETGTLKRRHFGSPFGVALSPEFSVCIGAIRGLFWESNNLHVAAGGGVIAESCLDDEWDEINLKLNAIKQNFSLS